MQQYFLRLDNFEGPLDLLLGLIKVHEIDIFRIDVVLLTNQYLEYLRLLKFEDLHHAGAFLEMAATLLELKSRWLLPGENTSDKGEDDPDEGEELLSNLQQRLLTYEMFKKAAGFFSMQPTLGVDICTNNEWERLEPQYADLEAPLHGDSVTLVVLYDQMLKTFAHRRLLRKKLDQTRLSIEDKIKEINALIERVNFALFQGFYPRLPTRADLVISIMAFLEMCRQRKLKLYQESILGPIWLYRIDLTENDLPLSELNTASTQATEASVSSQADERLEELN